MKKQTTVIVIVLILIIVSLVCVMKFKRPIKNLVKKIMPVTVLKEPPAVVGVKIIFLHHSTGLSVWNGGVSQWFEQFRQNENKNYYIVEQMFPKTFGNYPYDYWNVWINHQGNKPYKNEPTLEMITSKYNVIIWKHCYPVSDIIEDTGNPDINSEVRSIENYKLHYNALKEKMHQFADNKFIVWTGATRVKNATNEENAKRSKLFFDWVRNEWDEPGDNIFIWDFYGLETEGELYLKDTYSLGLEDSHPNESFAKRIAPLFCQRIVNVIEEKGDTSNIVGERTKNIK